MKKMHRQLQNNSDEEFDFCSSGLNDGYDSTGNSFGVLSYGRLSQKAIEDKGMDFFSQNESFYSRCMKIFKELSDACEGYQDTENIMIQKLESLLIEGKILAWEEAKLCCATNASQHEGAIISSSLATEKDKVYHRKKARHEVKYK
jgi:hypothetical protein